MLAPWAKEEMATADLEDKRLNRRLTRLLSAISERPVASIPAACGGHAEMTAAYRLFDNPKVTHEKVLQPHIEVTRQRMAQQKVVLLVQDTTELDLTRPQQQVEGAGPLDGPSRRGALVHLLEAFTTDGTPLGAVWAEMWTRDDEQFAEPQQEKRRQRKALPIEEKESFRWLEGLRQSREVAQQLPEVTCVCVGDSEADIYHLFAEPRGACPVHWLIRACQERCAWVEGEGSGESLRDRVMGTPVLFTKEVTVRGRRAKTSCETRARREPRESRTAEVEIRARSAASSRSTTCRPRNSESKLTPASCRSRAAAGKTPRNRLGRRAWIMSPVVRHFAV